MARSAVIGVLLLNRCPPPACGSWELWVSARRKPPLRRDVGDGEVVSIPVGKMGALKFDILPGEGANGDVGPLHSGGGGVGSYCVRHAALRSTGYTRCLEAEADCDAARATPHQIDLTSVSSPHHQLHARNLDAAFDAARPRAFQQPVRYGEIVGQRPRGVRAVKGAVLNERWSRLTSSLASP